MNHIDLPTYSYYQAAWHVRVPYGTVRSWLGRDRGDPLVLPADADRGLLSFRNLSELHVLRVIRAQHGISLQAARIAVDYLRREFKTDHPLTDIQMKTDGVSIFVEQIGELINASKAGQLAMRRLLEDFLDRIEINEEDRVAVLKPLFRSESRAVVISPYVHYGAPCVSGSGVPTAVVADRFNAGETVAQLVNDYSLEHKLIEDAIYFESKTRAA